MVEGEIRLPKKTTEHLHAAAQGLDARPVSEIADLLAQGQAQAAAAVASANDAICEGAEQMARTIAGGGVLHYVAAGSSGLMSAADAQELGGTFSIPPAQLRIHMAGGLPTGVEMPGGTEDETAGLEAGLASLDERDTVIAVSASGSTPYTLAAMKIAQAAGARVIGIANNAGSELLEQSDIQVLLQTPPEVISGSTRMGAGTAQKIALNMLSTLMAIKLGHVHDGMMVNLTADNAKLRLRARGIVERVADVDETIAEDALAQTNGRVKSAVLLASGARDAKTAETLLEQTGGHLRPALAQMKTED